MKHSMNDILALVRSGRLQDATDAIQQGLRGDEAMPDAPMKDVTPRPRALSGPQEDIAARGKPANNGGWSRRDGPLSVRLYTPSAPVADAPLIVMLHGCTQTPEDFALGTRMNAAAEVIGAHVIWPEQARSANPNGCWNWFEPGHQGRTGEAAAIAAAVRAIAAEVAPMASGIHVAGLSAGGAMAAILGTRYPEIFASVGVHSGLPVGSAQDVMSAFAAMRSGGIAGSAMPVPLIVFHGSADRTVAPANGAALAGAGPQGSKPRRRTTRIGGRDATVTRTETPEGRPASEFWQVDGLGHAWSGGDGAGSFADPQGPDATAEMLRFFAEVDRR